ncbi:hypothetical protein Tco_0604490 [Tanacetum coccineum]
MCSTAVPSQFQSVFRLSTTMVSNQIRPPGFLKFRILLQLVKSISIEEITSIKTEETISSRHTGRRREPDFERYVKTMRQVLRNMQKTKVHNLESPYGKFNLYAFKICYCNTASNSGSGTLPGKLLPTLRKIIRLSLPEVGLPSKVRKTVFLTSRWGQGTRMPTANTEATKDGFIPPCCSYSIIVINPESNVAPVVTSSS